MNFDGLFFALIGYLIGSIPTGVILTKFFSNIDPRQHGSKNIGATNIFRTAGKLLGILTLVGDMLKGALPVFFAAQWLGQAHFWIALTAASAVAGHIFPVFLGFKGGKGVATALGAFIALSLSWPAFLAVLIEAAIYFLIVWKWRFISVASMACALTMPILMAFFRSESPSYYMSAIVIGALIIYRHQSNITRLLQGTENKWKMG